ncbi:hypothetical protein [Geodermatophilus sp. CPCC 205761]|uniref:hypothetical protein n=3 Tax=unclassified Geodermatophilus TaxID=2637632 RepID=UPI003EEE4BA4
MFRKKTHGQIIGEELTEGFSHIGTAMAEAGRAAAEQLAPRVEAAREATGPALEAARVAVAPKVAAAAAVAAPAVEAAREALSPRLEAAREAAAPHIASAVTAAQAAATRAAADFGPRVEAAREAAQKTLAKDVVPRLTAAQAATLAYATPKVLAAREAVTPVFENTRETIAAGLHNALEELEVRREEMVASTAEAKKQAAKKRKALEKKSAKTAKKAKRTAGMESPRRWPWLLAVVAIGAVAFAVLRRRKDDELWNPAPTGDGPVPSYREDPVPSSPSHSGKTVSEATTAPGDSTPPDSDMGMQPQQLAHGSAGPVEDTPFAPGAEGVEDEPGRGAAPEPFSDEGPGDAGPTAGPADRQR